MDKFDVSVMYYFLWGSPDPAHSFESDTIMRREDSCFIIGQKNWGRIEKI